MSAIDADSTQNRGPAVLAGTVSTWVIAVVFMFLRFASRKIAKNGFWLDDYLIFAGFVWGFSITLQTFVRQMSPANSLLATLHSSHSYRYP